MVECSSNLVMTVLVDIKVYRLHKVTQPNGQVREMPVKLVSHVAVENLFELLITWSC